MPNPIRFHLDENVDHAIAYGLRRHGIDVTVTSEVGLLHAPDDEQLAFARDSARVIVTHDEDFPDFSVPRFQQEWVLISR